jgi:hypothetical protein
MKHIFSVLPTRFDNTQYFTSVGLVGYAARVGEEGEMRENTKGGNYIVEPKRIYMYNITNNFWGSWLRHFATSQKVAVSIPGDVTGFFN